jgi:hypothetical protein
MAGTTSQFAALNLSGKADNRVPITWRELGVFFFGALASV